jgi:arylsulfatase A-like enzyme
MLFACNSPTSPTESAADRPNIIFIMTDDHAYQAISAYGSDRIQTPNIDRIATNGMRFDRAFVTNSICAPSRAVILTGKHSHINGVLNNAVHFDSTQTIYPQILQQNGYQTAMIGKWHLKTEPRGFDYWKILPGQGHYYNPDWRTASGMVRDTGYVTDIITDEALGWLESGRDGDKPFMLVYQHKAPHRAWMPGPDHLGDLIGTAFPRPATLDDDFEGRGRAAKEQELTIMHEMSFNHDMKIPPEISDALGIEGKEALKQSYTNMQARMTPEQRAAWAAVYDPIIADLQERWPMTEAELLDWKYQRYMEDYLGCIQSVDDNIGRLLDYLDEKGLAENTLIVYTSDQGFYMGEHGWFDKRFMYEESFRTPLLVSWPGVIQPGTTNDQLVQNLDFAQTILEAAQVSAPGDMQGQSLVPLFKGEKVEWRDALYYHYYEYPSVHAVKRHYGVRTDQYKLIHFYRDIDEWEMYDLSEDPQEMQSVYGNPAYADVQAQLHLRLKELQEQYQDPIESELAAE